MSNDSQWQCRGREPTFHRSSRSINAYFCTIIDDHTMPYCANFVLIFRVHNNVTVCLRLKFHFKSLLVKRKRERINSSYFPGRWQYKGSPRLPRLRAVAPPFVARLRQVFWSYFIRVLIVFNPSHCVWINIRTIVFFSYLAHCSDHIWPICSGHIWSIVFWSLCNAILAITQRILVMGGNHFRSEQKS